VTSSTTDRAEHPDVTEISDLAEGLLTPSRSSEVRRHLDGCAPCADVYTTLEEIRGLLGSLPGPTRMPDDIAGRIDAALAAEARPEEPSDRTRVSRETTSSVDRPGGRAAVSSTGPGRKRRPRNGRRRTAALGAVVAVAALGLGSVVVSSLGGGDSSPGDPGRSARADTYSEEKLNTEVAALLADDRPGRGAGSSPAQSFGAESGTGAQNHVFTQPAVPACIQRGIGRDDAVLATEEGVYQGREVVLVVLPDTTDADRVMVYLVEAACVTRPSLGAGDVLLKDSFPRP
jgi:hypothetical protein